MTDKKKVLSIERAEKMATNKPGLKKTEGLDI